MVSVSAVLALMAVAAVLPSSFAQNSCTALSTASNFVHPNGTLIVRNTTNPFDHRGRVFQVDPWIQPPCATNATTGAVKCNCNNTMTGSPSENFLAFPMIYATCHDAINFTMHAVKSGLRVHGVYLVDPDFVDPAAPQGYRCPSPCTDTQYRNYNTSKSAGRCRGTNIQALVVDGKYFPIDASGTCSGYLQLYDGDLEVYAYPDASGSCNTSTVIVNGTCKSEDNVVVGLRSVAEALGFEGSSGTLVFSCPNISGNQPGGPSSHCDDGMALVVQINCEQKNGMSPKHFNSPSTNNGD